MPRPACTLRPLPVLILLLTLLAAFHPGPAAADYGEPADSRAELSRLLAPIALYPDRLLSQVLMAATYPIEVIEAERWIRQHPQLRGTSLDAALQDQPWDPSVKALCHFPDLLGAMSERIAETTELGNAFLTRQEEVMETVQELRTQAYGRGNLASTREQTVRVVERTIVIEPRDPRVIYVPYYDPLTIYGPWWYPAYPPLYWGPPGVSLGLGISFWPGIYFGFSWGNWIAWDWPHRVIYIRGGYARPRYVKHDHWPTVSAPWRHVPDHRRGLPYPDRGTAVRYGQPPPPPRLAPAPRPQPQHRPQQAVPPASRPAPRPLPQPATREERSRQEQQRIEERLRHDQRRQTLGPAVQPRPASTPVPAQVPGGRKQPAPKVERPGREAAPAGRVWAPPPAGRSGQAPPPRPSGERTGREGPAKAGGGDDQRSADEGRDGHGRPNGPGGPPR